ncbi:PASTA domain-containing protein [Micromonospora sp. WMMC241]|uniref:PASTA domain-containing protein n=1 Tax=Micromonospora sp. WMMC241 TaxID=3015159 RepID=UPI0022B71663|nr:PASTA domain-containing protein [Micromonospora sp. WMMC241]MCZ7440576.1 PASTA domain-containing protein [Micromonospora sp. WMMC241]
MSDDRREPPAGDADPTGALPPDRSADPTRPTLPDRAADPDATRAMPGNVAAGGDDADVTRAMPRGAAGGEDADATRAIPRDAAGGGDDVDVTRAMPRGADADATRAMPRDADVTRAMPGDRGGDATRVQPGGAGGDATRPLPGGPSRPLDATSRQEPVGGGAWSGRAGVPPPRPAGYPEPGAEWYGDEQAGRRWWMPILLGVLALVLIGLIALGVWLALRAADRDSGPGTSPSAAPSASAPTSAAPTSASPSSSSPSTPPTTTAAEVPMPPLVGLPESAARAALDRLGIDYRVQRRPSDRPAGTVIATDPEAGYSVGEGERVTLVVAEPAEPTTGAPTTARTTSGSTPTTTATP